MAEALTKLAELVEPVAELAQERLEANDDEDQGQPLRREGGCRRSR